MHSDVIVDRHLPWYLITNDDIERSIAFARSLTETLLAGPVGLSYLEEFL